MSFFRLVRALSALAVILAGLAAETEAASTLKFDLTSVPGESGKGPQGRIYAGPDAVMTLAGYGWKSVAAAQEVTRRLNALAEAGLRANEISVRAERRTRIIMARGERVVGVDRAMAAVHKSNPDRLARLWARNLREQFGRPYLSMRSLLIPLGEARSAPVRGNIVGGLAVGVEVPIVTATWDPAKKTLRVMGSEVGETKLVLRDDRSILYVPVRVARYAARIAGSLTAEVTGTPASAEVMIQAVKAAVGANLLVEPGAWANLTPQGTASLWPGRSAAIPVCVSAAGEDYLTCHLRRVVTVRNDYISLNPVDVLMVSNSPERLQGHGLWFEGKLTGAQAARVLYHHVNGTALPSDLVVELWNLGDQTARAHIIAGAGGPSRDEAWAGHRAATQFLGNRSRNVGWVAPVPPGAAIPVFSQPASPGATSSGILEVRLLGTGDLRIRIYLSPRRSQRVAPPAVNYREAPLAGRWLYPRPARELNARYVVGQPWAFITIGDPPVAGVVEGDLLLGNYGVMYDIGLDLINPTAETASVAVLIESAGGPARASLRVDGRQVETAVLRRGAEAVVARYLLAPGEVRRVHIETMPQAGSNYPVRLLARAT